MSTRKIVKFTLMYLKLAWPDFLSLERVPGFYLQSQKEKDIYCTKINKIKIKYRFLLHQQAFKVRFKDLVTYSDTFALQAFHQAISKKLSSYWRRRHCLL